MNLGEMHMTPAAARSHDAIERDPVHQPAGGGQWIEARRRIGATDMYYHGAESLCNRVIGP